MDSERQKYQETAQTWNKVAPQYEEKFMDLNLYDESYDALLGFLKPEQTSVLEVGCGPGNIMKYLKTKRADLHLSGIDVSENMVAIAQKNNPDAKVQVIDCRDLSRIKSKFDAIVLGFVVPYLNFQDLFQCIADSAELLNENGWIYVSFVPGYFEESGYIKGSTGDRMYFHYYDIDLMADLLQNNSFTIVAQKDIEYQKSEDKIEIHTVIIANKDAV